MRLAALLICFFLFQSGKAQLTISGIVFDNSKANYVENVRVVSSSGIFTITDSMGRYSILANLKDSLTFYYDNKPTQKFAVIQISDPAHFNISLHIAVKGKYSLLKEVTVFSKTHREDSLETRQTYANVFNYSKPGLKSSITPGGAVGADLNELVNMFRFRYNKRMKAFRQRLEEQEQDQYVNYRFNKTFVRRVTNLQSPVLDTFMVWYRPDYEFTRDSDEITFNQFILNSLYHFQKIWLRKPRQN